jgi:hypothetical protein
MNCFLHPNATAVAYCRACGRPLCAACQKPADGTIFCPEHALTEPYYAPLEPEPPNPYTQPPPPVAPIHTSPALAFLLGWIPGVGAIYNGQYIKGLVHAVIFGLIITVLSEANSGQPLFAILLAAFEFYMPFEAYHTARKRQLGLPLDEWSSLVQYRGYQRRAPVGAILLIVIGVLFLLDSLHMIPFRAIVHFWPVVLIVAGVYMLYSRLSGPPLPPVPHTPPAEDVWGTRHER